MSKRDPNAIRLLNLGPTAAWRTQAVYHAIAEMMTEESPDTIIICQPLTPYLCLGYHQIYDAVLDRGECERRNLTVVRRRVGGGTTYLDANQLFYQCVFHRSRVPAMFREVYSQMLKAPVATLRRLGLNAELRAVNEIEVNGKRIAGVGGGQIGEACVVVGNLLFDFDYNTLPQLWRTPTESFRALASAALRDRLTTIWRKSGPVTIEQVQWMLLEEFENALGRPIERGKPRQPETRRSRKVAERLVSEEYLNLHREGMTEPIPLMQSLKISAGVYIRAAEATKNGHRIHASFRVRDDMIEEARLESKLQQRWNEEEAALKGVRFKDWQQCLTSI